MAQLRTFISHDHPLSRFYVHKTMRLSGVRAQSIEIGFWFATLRESGELLLAQRLLDNCQLQEHPQSIRSWVEQQGFKQSATLIFHSADIYRDAILHQLEQMESPFRAAFVANLPVNPQAHCFMACSSTFELVWSCGLRERQAHIAHEYPGFDYYGVILDRIAKQFAINTTVRSSLQNWLSGSGLSTTYPPLTALLVSDSQLANVHSIEGGEAVKVSGGTCEDIVAAISDLQARNLTLSDYRFVIIQCGINDAQRPHSYQQYHWRRLREILLNEADRHREQDHVLFSPPFPHPRVPAASAYGRRVASELRGSRVRFIDWDAQVNPFVDENGQIRKPLFLPDGFHISRQGFRKLWQTWCHEFNDLRVLGVDITPERRAQRRKRRRVD